MDLATTDQIRQRLGLAVLSVDQSATIDAFRLAIQDRILSITGFLTTDNPYFSPIQQTEQQIDVQLGISRLMQVRPLIPMGGGDPQKTVLLEARSLASNTFNAILGDIIDPFQGRVQVLASELTPVFPPVGGLAPWFRWRQMIWPVVKFTYLVDPLGSPTNSEPLNSLNRAVVEWSAFIFARNVGLLQSFTAEKISESYFMKYLSVPPFVYAMLAKYMRTRASLIF